MMGNLPKKMTVGQLAYEQPCLIDITSKQVATLVKNFHQCCAYIKQHIADYISDNIAKMDYTFHMHQKEYSQGQLPLMRYKISHIIDATGIDNKMATKLQNLQYTSSTLPGIFCLKLWQENASKRLADLRNHPCMSPDTLAQTANDFTEKTMRKVATMWVEEEPIQDKKGNKMTHKSCCKKQVYAPKHLHNTDPQEFSDSVFSYLDQDLLPYWGKIVGLFLFHALNTSLAQGKMSIEEAEAQYKKACTTITDIYNRSYTEDYENYYNSELKKAMTYKPSKDGYNPIKIFTKLEKDILKPLTKRLDTLHKIIGKIEYSTTSTLDTSKLNKQLIGSLQLFYNIAYSFGIIDLITNFGDIISLYSSNLHQGIERNKVVKEAGIEAMRLLIAKVNLASFIEGNHAKQEQIDQQLNHAHLEQIHKNLEVLTERVNHLLKRTHKRVNKKP
ncbi:hypothetical protein [Cardinium endosymbiont of Sogatella furcifera]|uniref:hypothetical protein n=1 Tax=Cardinium endosymbiont of Sogatella furcifera TaxID=650378 RepID=UPI0013B3C6E7|nr:hypothetical protein [Cardinium endosymbiont of Sogatella furcifera]